LKIYNVDRDGKLFNINDQSNNDPTHDNNGYHGDQNDDRGDGDFNVFRNDVVDAGDIALTTLEDSHVRTSANVSKRYD